MSRRRIVHTSARSLERCRKLGWIADKVERWVPMKGHPAGGQRKDFLGAFDIIALATDRPNGDAQGNTWYDPPLCIGIQSCSMSGRAAHLAKLSEPETAARIREWLRCWSNRAELWAWRKLKVKRGGKAVRWECEVTALPVNGGAS